MNYIPHPITTEDDVMSDYYCGCGGSSDGATRAGAKVKMAANHNELAIKTHSYNHPDTEHYMVDLLLSDPRNFPYTPIAWFSPECTWHSLAMGKKRKAISQLDFIGLMENEPEEASRSRVTMWDVVRFTAHHRYQVVIVENVVEIKYWPAYDEWLAAMVNLGYKYKVCYFNSRFFHYLNGQDGSAPQNRDRIYIVFWRKGNRPPDLDFKPLAWCPLCEKDIRAVQVFKKSIFPLGLYDTTGSRGQYYYACPSHFQNKNGKRVPLRVEPYYFAAYNIIDPSLPMPLIGDRKKPLEANTLTRVKTGFAKYAGQPLMIDLTRSHALNKWAKPMTNSLPAQTTRQTLAFIVPFKGPAEYQPLKPSSEPVPTITTAGGPAIVSVPLAFIVPFRGDAEYQHLKASGEPMPTQCTDGKPAVVTLPILIEMYGNGDARPVDDVMPTATSGNRVYLATMNAFISSYYGRNSTGSGLDDPVPTITTSNRAALVMPNTPFITEYYGESDGARGVDQPISTLSTRHHHALVLPEDIDINACGFRMFEPDEIKLGQGFRSDYKIFGAKRYQVKQIGNAVSTVVAQFLIQAALNSLRRN